MTPCRLCRAHQVRQLLDFGPQPVCNRFLVSPDAEEAQFSIRLGQCRACGVVQLLEPMPAAECRPRVDWITYNEPEGHLDRLADVIMALPGITRDDVIGGVSFKDDTLLRRLREQGYARSWRIDPRGDLGIAEAGAGVESVQERLDPASAAHLAQLHGKANLVVARHIWEHASRPARFMDALKQLLRPQGYLVLEVPDCARALASCDFSTIWEEHALYFTGATFHHSVQDQGLSIRFAARYPYSLEDALVVIAQAAPAAPRREPEASMLTAELEGGEAFARGWAPQRERVGAYLARYRTEQGKVAMLGAGHLACTFINLLGVREHLDCLVDDNPHKRGCYMPGSRLPIYGVDALRERQIKLCLLSVAPESEAKVIQRNETFIQAGGIFRSIFPASPHVLRF